MEKINIAELLCDCPQGMELDCTMFNDVKFIGVEEYDKPICIRTRNSFIHLTKFGTWNFDENAKCVIFPKGKTTWEGFHRPFKDGDILSYQNPDFKNPSIYIYNDKNNLNTSYYVALSDGDFKIRAKDCMYCALYGNHESVRFATEEEKQILFDTIKEHGYKWNSYTKTLEKLLKFKVGDKIKPIGSDYSDLCYRCYIIKNIEFDRYILDDDKFLKFTDEHNFELDKFDITILKPFDKVLVRTDNKHVWSIQFFERLNNILKDAFVCMGGVRYHQCIPYEGNEHLLNTVNDCEDYFKTWENEKDDNSIQCD